MQTLNNVPTEIEWRVYRGDTSKLTIQLKDDEGNTVPNADGILCVARRYPTDPEILAMMQVYFGTTPPPFGATNQGDSSTGIITVEIPWNQLISQQQDPFAWGKQFYFDVHVYFDSVNVTILKVKVDIESDVSRGQGVPNFV
jgi:hypothetical protein